MKQVGAISHPTMSQCLRLVKAYYIFLDFSKASQSVLIRNIRLSTFSFITTTLHDVIDKINISVVHLSLHILALTIGFHCPERFCHMITLLMLDYHRVTFIKPFWLKNLWVDIIQFPTHPKKSVKTNNNQYFITKKLNWYSMETFTTYCRDELRGELTYAIFSN